MRHGEPAFPDTTPARDIRSMGGRKAAALKAAAFGRGPIMWRDAEGCLHGTRHRRKGEAAGGKRVQDTGALLSVTRRRSRGGGKTLSACLDAELSMRAFPRWTVRARPPAFRRGMRHRARFGRCGPVGAEGVAPLPRMAGSRCAPDRRCPSLRGRRMSIGPARRPSAMPGRRAGCGATATPRASLQGACRSCGAGRARLSQPSAAAGDARPGSRVLRPAGSAGRARPPCAGPRPRRPWRAGRRAAPRPAVS